MVVGVIQATLFSSKESKETKARPSVSWSLPAWVHPISSSSWAIAFPSSDFRATILHPRIADALGIKTGDDLEFEIEGEKFKLPVSVTDKASSDLTISWDAGIIKSSSILKSGECTAELQSGKTLRLLDQELFDSSKMNKCKGRGILYFDGVSRNEPHNGPAGVGFTIYTLGDDGRTGKVLVSGYRFLGVRTSNHADYEAFLEGFEWVKRFNFEKLWIRGDSNLVINQLSGKFRVKSSNLKWYYNKASKALNEAKKNGVSVTLQHVASEKNQACEVLANLAIDLKCNAYSCNWKEINLYLNPEKYAVLEEEAKEYGRSAPSDVNKENKEKKDVIKNEEVENAPKVVENAPEVVKEASPPTEEKKENEEEATADTSKGTASVDKD